MNKPTIDDILGAMRLFGRATPDASFEDLARRVDIVRMLCVESDNLGADAQMRARNLADDLIQKLRATIRAAIRAQGVTL